jgi:hypothetical protein
MFRRIFGPKSNKVTEKRKNLHNEKLHKFFLLEISVIKMIKSRTMRWTGHVARMGTIRNVYKIIVNREV